MDVVLDVMARLIDVQRVRRARVDGCASSDRDSYQHYYFDLLRGDVFLPYEKDHEICMEGILKLEELNVMQLKDKKTKVRLNEHVDIDRLVQWFFAPGRMVRICIHVLRVWARALRAAQLLPFQTTKCILGSFDRFLQHCVLSSYHARTLRRLPLLSCLPQTRRSVEGASPKHPAIWRRDSIFSDVF